MGFLISNIKGKERADLMDGLGLSIYQLRGWRKRIPAKRVHDVECLIAGLGMEGTFRVSGHLDGGFLRMNEEGKALAVPRPPGRPPCTPFGLLAEAMGGPDTLAEAMEVSQSTLVTWRKGIPRSRIPNLKFLIKMLNLSDKLVFSISKRGKHILLKK